MSLKKRDSISQNRNGWEIDMWRGEQYKISTLGDYNILDLESLRDLEKGHSMWLLLLPFSSSFTTGLGLWDGEVRGERRQGTWNLLGL